MVLNWLDLEFGNYKTSLKKNRWTRLALQHELVQRYRIYFTLVQRWERPIQGGGLAQKWCFYSLKDGINLILPPSNKVCTFDHTSPSWPDGLWEVFSGRQTGSIIRRGQIYECHCVLHILVKWFHLFDAQFFLFHFLKSEVCHVSWGFILWCHITSTITQTTAKLFFVSIILIFL